MGLPEYLNLPLFVRKVIEVDLQTAGREVTREFLSPFDKDDGVLVPEIVEAKGLELRKAIQTVEVDVIDLGVTAVFVNKCESGAGYVLGRRCAEPAHDAFGEGGFTGP